MFRQDPFVSLIAPSDGVYIVQVRETNYGGGDTNRYVLHVGTFLRPAAVFPAGGQAGTDVKLTLFGDRDNSTQILRLPAVGTPVEFYPSDGTVAAPTPNPFRVSSFSNVIEAEPMTISSGELPAGIKATINTIPAGEHFVPVVFEAAPDAPVGGKFVSFTGKNADGTVQGGFKQVFTLISGPGDSAFYAVEVSQLAVVVVEPVSNSVSIVPPTAPLPTDGTLDVKVRVTREGFYRTAGSVVPLTAAGSPNARDDYHCAQRERSRCHARGQ